MADDKHPDLGTKAVWTGEAGSRFEDAARTGAMRAFEQKMAALEVAPAALGFASGQGAVAAVLLALLEPGDALVSVQGPGSRINAPILELLARMGIKAHIFRPAEAPALAQALARGCRVVWLQSPAFPRLEVPDLAGLGREARRAGALVVADNTLATPINQQPLALGADLVVHTSFRFLGGLAHVRGGAVCGPRDLVEKIASRQEGLGSAMAPEAASTLLQGLKTLPLRMARQNRSALALAHWLEDREQVEKVFYPGLPNDPGHETASAQMRGFGGVLSFALKGGDRAAERFSANLRYSHSKAFAGGVESAAILPARLHGNPAPDSPPGLVLYSVGVENVEDLRDDLAGALAAVDGPDLEKADPLRKEIARPHNPFEELYAFLIR